MDLETICNFFEISGIEVVILRFNIPSIFNEADDWFYDVQCSLSIVNVTFISVKNFNYHNYICYVIIHITLHIFKKRLLVKLLFVKRTYVNI